MKGLALIGILLVVLGILAFVVPIRHRQDHSVRIGDASFGVQTEESHKLPTPVGIVLVAAGVVLLLVGNRKS
jgi:uncharacterized protein YjeT (DUF2065 family)